MSTRLSTAAEAFFAYEWAYCATISHADTEERYARRDQLRHEIAESERERRALRDLTDAQEWFDSREHAGECFGHHVHPAKLCVGCESAFERLLVKRAAARAVLSENPIGETT